MPRTMCVATKLLDKLLWNRVLKVPNFSFQRWTTFGDPEWKQLREKKCPFGIVRQVSKSNTESSRKDTLDVVHDSFHLVKAGEAERTRSIKFKQELTVMQISTPF